MRQSISRAIFYLILVSILNSAFPVDADELLPLRAQIEQARKLKQAEKFDEAVAVYASAIVAAKQKFGESDARLLEPLLELAALSQKIGQYVEAEAHYLSAITIQKKVLGPNHLEVSHTQIELAKTYYHLGRLAEAQPLLERAIGIRESALGPEHAGTGDAIHLLGRLFHFAKLYAPAEKLMQRGLSIREKALGPDHPDTMASLANLAELYKAQKRLDKAAQFYQRAQAGFERTLGPNDLKVAWALNERAVVRLTQNSQFDAEPLLRRALEIREKKLGPDHSAVAVVHNNLGAFYREIGRYPESEKHLKRSLASRKKHGGPEHEDYLWTLNHLRLLYEVTDRAAEAAVVRKEQLAASDSFNRRAQNLRNENDFVPAIGLLRRRLVILEKVHGEIHADVASTLADLNRNYTDIGQLSNAEAVARRALSVEEKRLGPDHAEVAVHVNNLGHVLRAQGREVEAEPLFKRSLAIAEKAYGPDHPHVASVLHSLAYLYRNQGRFRKAEPLYRRSLEIREKALGPSHPWVAQSLINLGELSSHLGNNEEFFKLTTRALRIYEKIYGKDHIEMTDAMNNLALRHLEMGQTEKGVALLRRAVRIEENELGKDHPQLIESLANLAVAIGRLESAPNRRELLSEAMAIYVRAEKIARKTYGVKHLKYAHVAHQMAVFLVNHFKEYPRALRILRGSTIARIQHIVAATGGPSDAGTDLRRQHRTAFLDHLQFVGKVTGPAGIDPHAAAKETFEIAQMMGALNTARAVGRMAARLGAGDDELARLIRERQDATDRWRRLDGELIRAVSRSPRERDQKREAELKQELGKLSGRLRAIGGTIKAKFPNYGVLAEAQPLLLKDVQPMLGEDEALMLFVSAPAVTFLYTVRREQAEMFVLPIGADKLAGAVRTLRTALDATGVRNLQDINAYPTTAAFELYKVLFSAAEHLLQGVRQLIVVPDGALQSLPLSVLVTEAQKSPPANLADYRRVPWLAKRFAVTVLPSVSSLRALRMFAAKARAPKPFIGFGDPLLKGHPGGQRSASLAALFSRGSGLADPAQVKQLPALPETATELRMLATSLGAGPDAIILRNQATETRVKTLDLKAARIVAFATHGLMAGDFEKVGEPSLVLTPPETASPLDDGLLTASEVTQLDLNADLVILSACNTAAPDGTPGAEGLSGLAKAFFYAGSRSLMVSHWPVASRAAVKLTTRMLADMVADPTIGRSEALRRSRMALMEDSEEPFYAHPMFWAPFVIVGEGGNI